MLFMFWLTASVALVSGHKPVTECITCTNIEVSSSDISKEAQTYLSKVRVPACKRAAQPSLGVTYATCPDSDLQRVSRCGRVTIMLTPKLSDKKNTFDVDIHIYHRACFSVKRTMEPKCYRSLTDLNEHLRFINATLEKMLMGSAGRMKVVKAGVPSVEFCIGKGSRPSSMFSVTAVVLVFALYI